MEPFIVYMQYLWYKTKYMLCVLLLSGCLTYGVENYNPALFPPKEEDNEN